MKTAVYVAIATLLLEGCGGCRRLSTAHPPGTVRVALGAEPRGLTRVHDLMGAGDVARLIQGTVYETLARVDVSAWPRLALKPQLASEWTWREEGRILRVQLREDVRFHDGTPLGARDVAAMLEAIRTPGNPTAAFRSAVGDLVRIEVLGPHVLEVEWSSPRRHGPETLLALMPILPASALEGPFASLPVHQQPVGTGPYRLERWDVGRGLTLKRWAGYRNPAPRTDVIEVSFFGDAALLERALKERRLDAVFAVPAARLSLPPEGYRRVPGPPRGLSYLLWNTRRGRAGDAAFRRALAARIPWGLLATDPALRAGQRAHCLFPPGSPSCDAGQQPSGGVAVPAGEDRGITLSLALMPQALTLATALKAEWRNVGVETTLREGDWSRLRAQLEAGDFDAALLAVQWQDAEPDWRELLHSGGTRNWGGYQSDETDALLDAIAAARDDAIRQAAERALDARVRDDVPLVPLYVLSGDALVRQGLEGVVPAASGYELFAPRWEGP